MSPICGRILQADRFVSPVTFLAASRWVQELHARTVDEAILRLQLAPSYRDLTPTQYQRSLEWLRDIGMVDEVGLTRLEPIKSSLLEVLRHYLEQANPAWLDDFANNVNSAAELPIDLLQLVDGLRLPEFEILDLSSHVARKFDDTAQQELGALGERLLVESLRARTSATVEHVSLSDDTLGFDVLVSDHRNRAEVEVKTCRALRPVRFFLSRNEFEHMRASPRWVLQIVTVIDHRIADYWTVEPGWIEESAPRNVHDASRWESIQVVVPEDALVEGLHHRLKVLLD